MRKTNGVQCIKSIHLCLNKHKINVHFVKTNVRRLSSLICFVSLTWIKEFFCALSEFIPVTQSTMWGRFFTFLYNQKNRLSFGECTRLLCDDKEFRIQHLNIFRQHTWTWLLTLFHLNKGFVTFISRKYKSVYFVLK